MFYSHLILSNKGPLGTVWIAAHLERRLKKSQVTETSINLSVDRILFSDVPIALRLSGHLLLGVVKIYARKVNYLYEDCTEALVKFKHVFQSGAVDLPPEAAKAPFHAITVPEAFDFDYSHEMSHQERFIGEFDKHQITDRDQITLNDPLQESFFLTSLGDADKAFGDGDHNGCEPEKVLLGTLPQEEPTQNIQTLEDEVLPPMTSNFEMDGNVECALEISGMEIDKPNVASVTPRVIDRTEVHVSQTSSLKQAQKQEMRDVQETHILEVLVNTGIQHLSAVDVPNVERLQPVAEPRFNEANEVVPLQKTLTEDEAPRPTIAPLLVEGEQLSKWSKEQGLKSVCSRESPYSFSFGVSTSATAGGTPSIQVASTPTKTQGPSHARGARRKSDHCFDTTIAIPNEVMKHQVANTDDLRRTRRKTSIHHFEECISERAYQIKETFPKSTIQGLSPELLELFNETANVRRESGGALASPTSCLVNIESGTDATDHPDVGHIHRVDILNREVHQQPISADVRMAGLHADMNALEVMPFPTCQMEIELNPAEIDEVLVKDLHSSAKLGIDVGGEEATVSHHVEQVSDQLQGGLGATKPVLMTDGCQRGEQAHAKSLNFLSDSTHPENGKFQDDLYAADHTKSSTSQHLDEVGWPDRTRAIAEFWQGKFKAVQKDGKGLQQLRPSSLSLVKLLRSKCKKQAARLFFEILVLKTQDYIEVVQVHPYGAIALSACPKLLKATF